MNGHPRDKAKVSVHCRWPLIGGNLTLTCVGRGIDNVAVQGSGRSRRGSPKAGTTVPAKRKNLNLLEKLRLIKESKAKNQRNLASQSG